MFKKSLVAVAALATFSAGAMATVWRGRYGL